MMGHDAVQDPAGLEIVLASASPRRRDLLARLGVPFRVVASHVDESADGLTPRALVAEVASRKAWAVAKWLDLEQGPPGRSILVIGADTVIECDGQIMGKPVNAADAVAMLTRLSGRSHSVLTGVSVILARHGQCSTATGVDESRLIFRTLSADEIQCYVDSGEPLDKAGSYAIQGAGAAFVQILNGSHSNVVGLPLSLLRQLSRQVGVDLPHISGEWDGP